MKYEIQVFFFFCLRKINLWPHKHHPVCVCVFWPAEKREQNGVITGALRWWNSLWKFKLHTLDGRTNEQTNTQPLETESNAHRLQISFEFYFENWEKYPSIQRFENEAEFIPICNLCSTLFQLLNAHSSFGCWWHSADFVFPILCSIHFLHSCWSTALFEFFQRISSCQIKLIILWIVILFLISFFSGGSGIENRNGSIAWSARSNSNTATKIDGHWPEIQDDNNC